jgi:hypothetical protein
LHLCEKAGDMELQLSCRPGQRFAMVHLYTRECRVTYCELGRMVKRRKVASRLVCKL